MQAWRDWKWRHFDLEFGVFHRGHLELVRMYWCTRPKHDHFAACVRGRWRAIVVSVTARAWRLSVGAAQVSMVTKADGVRLVWRASQWRQRHLSGDGSAW